MAERVRKWSKYERFRLRPAKDADLYDAIEYAVEIGKQDFPDIARAALRAYLGLTPGNTLQLPADYERIVEVIPTAPERETPRKPERIEESRARDEGSMPRMMSLDLSDIELTRKEPETDALEAKLSGILRED